VQALVEQVGRHQAAGEEQVEHDEGVDEAHALDVNLAHGVGHGRGYHEGQARGQHGFENGDDQAVRVDLGVEDLDVVLEVEALEPEHQPALDIFVVGHDRGHNAVPQGVEADKAE